MNAILADRITAPSEVLPRILQGVTTFEDRVSSTAPEESLAIGVLSQVFHDLRRFHEPANQLERELYRDAYDWLMGTDFTWPYSFVNICNLLNVPPEELRAELLADASLGWLGYWCKLGERVARSFKASVTRTFHKPCSEQTATRGEASIYRFRTR